MKAKEKGIPESELYKRKDNKSDRHSSKFNAFREMDKIKKGMTPNLAQIKEGTAVVGTPKGVRSDSKSGEGKKRGREEDGEEEKPAKSAKKEVRLRCARVCLR